MLRVETKEKKVFTSFVMSGKFKYRIWLGKQYYCELNTNPFACTYWSKKLQYDLMSQ